MKYVNSVTKVCIVCPVHGDFWVRPADHIHSKVGCPRCSGLKKSNTEEFIEKARKKYGDKYDYSKVNYVNSKTKVCIVCHEKDVFGNEHGEFWQRPNDHLNGARSMESFGNVQQITYIWEPGVLIVIRTQKVGWKKKFLII